MPGHKEILELKQALRPFTGRAVHYNELTAREQIIDELCNALYVQLDNLLDELENGVVSSQSVDPEKSSSLQAVFHLLGSLAGAGVLDEALHPDNLKMLQKTLGDVRGASDVEKAMRKMDEANALKAEAETDAFSERDQRIEDAMEKKKK